MIISKGKATVSSVSWDRGVGKREAQHGDEDVDLICLFQIPLFQPPVTFAAAMLDGDVYGRHLSQTVTGHPARRVPEHEPSG